MISSTLEKTPKMKNHAAIAEQSFTYDLAVLSEIAAGNNDFVLSLVKIFLETIPANAEEMLNACAHQQWDMVSKLAHKLKSTIDMMRIDALRQDIRTIELDAKNQVNKEMLTRLVQKVYEIIKLTAAQLRQQFNLA